MATYADAEDLINVGAYAEGSNPEIDRAIEKIGAIRKFLRQETTEQAPLEDTLNGMIDIIGVEAEDEDQ